MAGALTPDLAAAYVRELSADVRGVVVLAPGGQTVAGPPRLHGPARALAQLLPEGVVRTGAGMALVARAGGHALVVAAGPPALVAPTALDAAAAVAALAGVPAGAPPGVLSEPSGDLLSAARALIEAS